MPTTIEISEYVAHTSIPYSELSLYFACLEIYLQKRRLSFETCYYLLYATFMWCKRIDGATINIKQRRHE